jgi:hypothetical protein
MNSNRYLSEAFLDELARNMDNYRKAFQRFGIVYGNDTDRRFVMPLLSDDDLRMAIDPTGFFAPLAVGMKEGRLVVGMRDDFQAKTTVLEIRAFGA